MVSRRLFLKSATSSAVTFALAPLLVQGCSSSDDTSATPATTPTSGACDGAGATSTTVGGHTHTVCVAKADITTPPNAGMTFASSAASDGDSHTHDVVLTQAQLQSLAAGQHITITSSLTDSHTHDFALAETA